MDITVILSKNVYYQIEKDLKNAKNDYEIGGVLIGYKEGKVYFIVGTTSSTEITNKSKVSFVLDGNQHTKKALKMIKQFQHNPSVLGVWHSHICDDTRFSVQDRLSNQKLAKFFNGALSMLVIFSTSRQELNVNVFFITVKGIEYRCHTIIDLYDEKIPYYYRKHLRTI